MSVEGINITLTQVSQISQSIRDINGSLSTRLEEIKREMNQLNASWQSESATTIINNFNALAPRFDEYKQVIDSYSTFLDKVVVMNYDSAETSVLNNANAFK